jgi:hypothetical protein
VRGKHHAHVPHSATHVEVPSFGMARASAALISEVESDLLEQGHQLNKRLADDVKAVRQSTREAAKRGGWVYGARRLWAVIKNGFASSPGGARAGGFDDDIEQALLGCAGNPDAHIFVAYLAWRLCALICASFALTASVVLSLPTLDEVKAPPVIRMKPFNLISETHLMGLLLFVQYRYWALYFAEVAAFVLTVAAAWVALPRNVLNHGPLSRRLSASAWLVRVLPRFVIYTLIPIRGIVDYEAITRELCMSQTSAVQAKPISCQILCLTL